MFVVPGARDRLIDLRRKEFAEQYVDPLVTEARRIGIDTELLIEIIRHPPDRTIRAITDTIHPWKKARRHDSDRCIDHVTRHYRGAPRALDDVTTALQPTPSPGCSGATAPASPP